METAFCVLEAAGSSFASTATASGVDDALAELSIADSVDNGSPLGCTVLSVGTSPDSASRPLDAEYDLLTLDTAKEDKKTI